MGILAELLSSKIRAEIFRNIFGIAPDTSLYMREIERRTGFAIGTVQTELKKLQRLDIISRVKDGNRVYYRANTALFYDLQTSGISLIIGHADRSLKFKYKSVKTKSTHFAELRSKYATF